MSHPRPLKEGEYVVPHGVCVVCGHHFDLASNATGERGPQPGDASVCVVCGDVTFFDEEMRRRPATPEELAEMPEDAKRAIAAIKLTNKIAKATGMTYSERFHK